MTKRYYAQFTITDSQYHSICTSSWQVFDRQNTIDGGDCAAIALCQNKTYAYRIRDALNALELTDARR